MSDNVFTLCVFSSRWKVTEDMSWVELGVSDPRQPQAFYPIEEAELVQPGDILAARCLMVPDTDSHEVTLQGLSSHMEMCDFFLYFFTRREDLVNSPAGQQCTNRGPPEVSWSSMGLTNIPEKSYLLDDHFEK